jgi:hypothetical protein
MRLHLCQRISAVLLLLAATAGAGLLDGTAWDLDLVPTRQTAAKGAKPYEDVLTFAHGHAISNESKRAGLSAVRYSATGANGFYNWETAPVLRERHKAQWGGVINGRNISGTLKRVTREGRELYYNFQGRKR